MDVEIVEIAEKNDSISSPKSKSTVQTETQQSPSDTTATDADHNETGSPNPNDKSTIKKNATTISPSSLKSPSPGSNLVGKSKDNERKRKLSPEEAENKKKAKLEREMQRKEKEMKKNEMKIQRDKEKEEKQLEKERREREKEEKRRQQEIERQTKKEQQEKEKEEKQKLREEEKKKKEEEKRKKEDERKKKEEERKKKDEERKKKEEERKKKEEEKRLVAEEEERKRERKRKAFKSFFIKNTQATAPKEKDSAVPNLLFKPFQLRPGMSLAPIHPSKEQVSDKDEFDKLFEEQTLSSNLYLESLRRILTTDGMKYLTKKKWKEQHETEPQPSQTSDDCVEIIEKDKESVDCFPKETKMVKLLQFHENTRPAWYGTWRKTSKKISGRKPFQKDEDVFNYEIDSDDEWEEEDPGESLSSVEDDDKDDDVEKDHDEDDDGFFVPHGYLSDDEGIDADEEDNQDTSICQSPKVSNEDDSMAREKVTQPVCIGCVWGTRAEDYPPSLRSLKVNLLANYTPEPFDVEEDELIRSILSKRAASSEPQCVMVN